MDRRFLAVLKQFEPFGPGNDRPVFQANRLLPVRGAAQGRQGWPAPQVRGAATGAGRKGSAYGGHRLRDGGAIRYAGAMPARTTTLRYALFCERKLLEWPHGNPNSRQRISGAAIRRRDSPARRGKGKWIERLSRCVTCGLPRGYYATRCLMRTMCRRNTSNPVSRSAFSHANHATSVMPSSSCGRNSSSEVVI